MADTPPSKSPSRTSTPNPRFTSRNVDDEDLLKEQTVGLVHLSDFKKKRLGIEESRDATPLPSGATTPNGRELSDKPAFKKRKKIAKKGGLSFGDDEEDVEDAQAKSHKNKAEDDLQGSSAAATDTDGPDDAFPKKRLKPNTSVNFQPKALTKSAALREAQLKDQLRKEYAQRQEAVRETEFCLPFVFFAGKNTPGGVCRMKKGDAIWLFLERARKVGADMAAKGDQSKRDWARISVDDLMVVRGDLVVPHHYDFHHFILNKSTGYNNTPLFAHSADPTTATPRHLLPFSSGASTPSQQPSSSTSSNLTTHADLALQRQAATASHIPDAELEGFDDDPSLTKVVDRRWYERNKHIYPASMWEDFDPGRDYSQGPRKDGLGNAMFFSR